MIILIEEKEDSGFEPGRSKRAFGTVLVLSGVSVALRRLVPSLWVLEHGRV